MASSSGSDDSPRRLTTTVGFPEEQSLSHIIRTRFPHGMPEDSIAIIMRQILKALNHLHVSNSTDQNKVNSSKICVDTEQDRTAIKLAVDQEMEQGGAPIEGTWGLGITALEMGYGSLPNCKGLGDWFLLTYNLIRTLKLKLACPDKKGKEKAKNKGKGKLESPDDQKLKEMAIQKGKGKLVMDDDQEMKLKAMLKGKEKLELSDDPKGKEMAKQKGKEKLEIADEELKKTMIKLPGLEKVMENRYVEHLEEKLKKKKATGALTAIFKAMKIFGKNKNKNADEGEFSDDNAYEKEFSRDFLNVVLMCLEEFNLTAVERILAQPLFQKPIDVQKFERSMRSPLPSDDDN